METDHGSGMNDERSVSERTVTLFAFASHCLSRTDQVIRILWRVCRDVDPPT